MLVNIPYCTLHGAFGIDNPVRNPSTITRNCCDFSPLHWVQGPNDFPTQKKAPCVPSASNWSWSACLLDQRQSPAEITALKAQGSLKDEFLHFFGGKVTDFLRKSLVFFYVFGMKYVWFSCKLFLELNERVLTQSEPIPVLLLVQLNILCEFDGDGESLLQSIGLLLSPWPEKPESCTIRTPTSSGHKIHNWMVVSTDRQDWDKTTHRPM